MSNFYSYCPEEGMELHDTLDEASDRAEEAQERLEEFGWTGEIGASYGRVYGQTALNESEELVMEHDKDALAEKEDVDLSF